MSVTCDPVFIVPEYGWRRAAWFAIHILASDSVTSGLKPKYLSIDLNLPMDITREQLDTVWGTIHDECLKMGISVITGHTAKYENCNYPMVGGATVIGIGDKIIITKGPAIEASGIFATVFPELLAKEFGQDFSDRAQHIFYKMSVVEDALTAVSVGVRDNGVTAMHDATECGIWGAVYEVAQAAGLGAKVEKDKIVVEPCVREICKYFDDIDPYSSISEGTLLITCRPHKAEEIIKLMKDKNIESSIVGELVAPEEGMILVENGREGKLEHPIVDPFWAAFYKALTRK